MRALLALVCIAGCYSPSIDSCFLACSSARECPDDLQCNFQNRCATTQATSCAGVGDGGVDDTGDGSALANVLITVVGPNNDPLRMVPVVFGSPTGDLIDTMMTNVSGEVMAAVPVGSTATVIRTLPSGQKASTYLDLWDGARIVSKFEASVGTTRTMTVTWTPPVMATNYDVRTTCGTHVDNVNVLEAAVLLPPTCPVFDVIVTARDSNGARLAVNWRGNVTALDGSTFALDNSNWKPITTTLSIALMPVPPSEVTLEIAANAYVTPELALGQPYIPIMGSPDTIAFPSPHLGATVQVRGTRPVNGTNAQQWFVDRLGVNATDVTIDLGERLPFIGRTTSDFAARTLSWTRTTDTIGTEVEPSLVFVDLQIQQNGKQHDWHIIAPGAHVTSSNATVSFALPEIPGANEFEPTETALAPFKTVTYLRVAANTIDAVRSRLEPSPTAPLFGIPGVSKYLRAQSF